MENIVTGPCRAHSQEALKQALEFVTRMLKGYRRLCVKTSAYCKPLWVVSAQLVAQLLPNRSTDPNINY